MENFNPNDIGIANGNFYGLPYSVEESDVVLVSVPWDVTTSYAAGTSEGPQAMLDASLQVDLFDESVPNAWEVKIGTRPIEDDIYTLNKETRKVAEEIIGELEQGADPASLEKKTAIVNAASEKVNDYVESVTSELLERGKKVGLIGGEHSVPYGYIKALAKKYDDFGVLHIDAHADLRNAYEGFEYSHASIMYNVLDKIPQVSRICQVAVRDFCSDESEIMNAGGKVTSFTDKLIHAKKFEGMSWKEICNAIIGCLPEYVYISFDIDGLSPELCPHTGTPVPGGMSFREADYLLEKLKNSGKKIIGFDLCEVAPGEDSEWDANVGVRMLFKLCLYINEKIS